MMSDAGYSYPNGYGSNGGVHYQDMNGDGHGHQLLSAYHENGRHHQPFNHLQYGSNPPFPRYPNFERLSHPDVNPREGTNAPLDTSQYPQYGCPTVPATHQPPPPPPAHPAQPLPYDTNCGPRPSLSPQESQQPPPPPSQQYPSCKMMQHSSSALHPLNNDMSPVGQPISPPPSHMYHNGPGNPHSPNRSVEGQSFLYPWMKSQFGKLVTLPL